MGDRHVSMIINAPPERVFKLYTDPGRAREWLSGVREVRATGPPDQPGSRAVFTYRWPFTMTAEVLRRSHPIFMFNASRSCWGWSPARPPPGSGRSRAQPSCVWR
jgi:hypothetical protein